jgi:hypothetical protein
VVAAQARAAAAAAAQGAQALCCPRRTCALRFPSSVTEVQPSGQVLSRQEPTLIIGSTVKICPAFMVPTWGCVWGG